MEYIAFLMNELRILRSIVLMHFVIDAIDSAADVNNVK